LGFIDPDGENPVGAAAAAVAAGRFVMGRFGRLARGRKKPSEPSIPLPPIPMPPGGKSETEPHDWNHNPGGGLRWEMQAMLASCGNDLL